MRQQDFISRIFFPLSLSLSRNLLLFHMNPTPAFRIYGSGGGRGKEGTLFRDPAGFFVDFFSLSPSNRFFLCEKEEEEEEGKSLLPSSSS